MGIGRAAGYPNQGSDGLNKLIPIMFSGKALERFYEKTCLTEISNTDYIGEISAMGDKVIINTIPDVPIRDYKKGQLLDVDYLESPAIEMTVDYAKSFNFAVDDIDLKQFKIKDWISKYADNAAQRVKIGIDSHVFGSIYADAHATNKGAAAGAISGNIPLGVTGTPIGLTKTTVIEHIILCGQCLDENNIPEEGRWMIIPAWMNSILKSSELKDASIIGEKSSLRNGRIGMINNFTLYNSNLLTKDSGTADFHVLFGHKSALAFASNFAKVEKYRPERSFADAMKGLNVYGFKTLQPTALGETVVKKG